LCVNNTPLTHFQSYVISRFTGTLVKIALSLRPPSLRYDHLSLRPLSPFPQLMSTIWRRMTQICFFAAVVDVTAAIVPLHTLADLGT